MGGGSVATLSSCCFENGETLEVAPLDVDVSKVIEYPGFTTEPPLGSIDVSFLGG